MGSVIVTLFEGDYVLGAGALANSLYRHGFRGRVYCGHKGPLLFWAKDAREDGAFRVLRPAEELELRFFPIEHPWHLTNLKPHMMLKVWDEWEPDAEAMFYFDPDITVKCRWSFFEEWVGYGVALCEEIVMANMPEDHPLRCAWFRWFEKLGHRPVRQLRGYINGGFVGLSSSARAFLIGLRSLLDAASSTVPMDRFLPFDRTSPFCMSDQDILNAWLHAYEGPISRVGPDGMDFAPAGVIMSHAAGGVKPWRKRFIPAALRGVPPTLADKAWLKNAWQPLKVLSDRDLRSKALSVRIASGIGRLMHRS